VDYAATKAYLYSLKTHGSKYGIDRMALLAARLGHPERAYPVIHIAGTNGKGSVAAMLEAIHRRVGRRVGLYTSPHLVHLGERVQVDRRPLSPEEITRYVAELRPHAEALGTADPDDHPSFFEFMTGIAFLHFAREKVDVALIEVGLGGRLDATNIVSPALTVITSIGLDHLEFLGDTLAAIAREKAGILKHGVPLVIGLLPPEAEEAVRAVAGAQHVRVYSVRECFGSDLERYPRPRLEGSHQRINAATALLAARVLHEQLPVTPDAVATALAEVDWPARWQRFPLADGRTLILDASHNEEGARMLDEQFARLRADTGRDPVVLVGALGEYRAQPLLAVIARHAREIVLVEPAQDRALSFAQLKQCIPPHFTGPVREGRVAELFPAPGLCLLGAAGDTVVVTGSIYLLGEILERFAPSAHPGEGSLQDKL
jgi:dihydrofolate synthase/folylpolyglutamate synthase